MQKCSAKTQYFYLFWLNINTPSHQEEEQPFSKNAWQKRKAKMQGKNAQQKHTAKFLVVNGALDRVFKQLESNRDLHKEMKQSTCTVSSPLQIWQF